MDEQPIINNLESIKKNIATPELVNEWQKWFLSQKYSIDSSLSYYSYLKKFVGFEINITQKTVDKFRESNFNSVSSSALKSFFKFLVQKKEYPKEILLITFEKNKQSRKLPKTISYDEVQLIINGMSEFRLRNKLMTMILYELSLRISESIKLQWKDFNWSEWLKDKTQYGKVNLENTKGNKFRVIPVKPELMNLLYDNHLARNSVGIPIGELLFESSDVVLGYLENTEQKRDMNLHDYLDYAKRTYRKKLTYVSKKVLGKSINPHMFRHSKAQHLLDNGMSLESLKEFLGHSSISTTQIYAQSSPESVKRELKQFDTKPISNENS